MNAHQNGESLSGFEKESGRPSTVKAHTKMESLSGVEKGSHGRPTLKTQPKWRVSQVFRAVVDHLP